MIAFYVQGGGLGHLTRTQKIINLLQLPLEDIVVITPSVFTHYFNFNVVKLNWEDTPGQWSQVIQETFLKYSIKTCYVDAFPFGLKGELDSVYKKFPEIKFNYVSRILKWSSYLQDIKVTATPGFSQTIVLEKLYEDHFIWIKNNSDSVKELTLSEVNISALKHLELQQPYALVVHSGGVKDVLAICKVAEKDLKGISDISILVCTQVELPKLSKKFKVILDLFPVNSYYSNAFKIYTAAGFNAISELTKYKEKYTAIPLEKQYDDQFFRLKHHNSLNL